MYLIWWLSTIAQPADSDELCSVINHTFDEKKNRFAQLSLFAFSGGFHTGFTFPRQLLPSPRWPRSFHQLLQAPVCNEYPTLGIATGLILTSSTSDLSERILSLKLHTILLLPLRLRGKK